MEEIWLENDGLVEEEKWKEEINSLRSEGVIKDKEVIKEKLVEAVKKRLRGRMGILFSGGVDSSMLAFLCQKLGVGFTCYAVGFQEGGDLPEDIRWARKVAEEFGFDLKYKIFNLKEIEGIIKKTIAVLRKVGKTDVVNVGVGAVVCAAIELAKKDEVDYFLSGLGSEEIFAGYERHEKVSSPLAKGFQPGVSHPDKDVINEECWKGLREMWNRDLVRDFTLAKELGVKIRTPFLDKELIKAAMQVSGELKINKENKKIILREIAEEFLGEFAWRRKKAAQYGSGFDKAIRKLAKRAGFRYKKDYLGSLK